MSILLDEGYDSKIIGAGSGRQRSKIGGHLVVDRGLNFLKKMKKGDLRDTSRRGTPGFMKM